MEQDDSPQPHGPDSADDAHPIDPDYGPVPLRYRHDGWVPDRQLEFIQALSACGCVDEAAKSVGMSRTSAYALRRRPDAQAFRLAWDAAMEAAVERLSDAAIGRAINGVPVPVYYKGEQIGEHRQFDERLTMFLLRKRHAAHYGQWIDRARLVEEKREARTLILNYRIARMVMAGWRLLTAALNGTPAPRPVEEEVPPEETPATDPARRVRKRRMPEGTEVTLHSIVSGADPDVV
jgi:hypothetical protein